MPEIPLELDPQLALDQFQRDSERFSAIGKKTKMGCFPENREDFEFVLVKLREAQSLGFSSPDVLAYEAAQELLQGDALTWEQVQQFGLQGVLQAHEFIMTTTEKLESGLKSPIPGVRNFFREEIDNILLITSAGACLRGEIPAGEAIETGCKKP